MELAKYYTTVNSFFVDLFLHKAKVLGLNG